MKIIKITGLGVAAIGEAGSKYLIDFSNEIIDKGGVPVAVVLVEGDALS